MKASIDQNGVLTVTPENGVEAYAVKMWAAHYHGFRPANEPQPVPPPGRPNSTLLIDALKSSAEQS